MRIFNLSHGTPVVDAMVGRYNGVCQKAKLILTPKPYARKPQYDNDPQEYIDMFSAFQLASLTDILDDVIKNKRGAQSVINMSWTAGHNIGIEHVFRTLYSCSPWPLGDDKSSAQVLMHLLHPGLLLQELNALYVVLVATAGNNGTLSPPIDTLPALLVSDDLPLIVVGATSPDSRRAQFSQTGSQLTVYAPGNQVLLSGYEDDTIMLQHDGTSFGMTLTALAASYYLLEGSALTCFVFPSCSHGRWPRRLLAWPSRHKPTKSPLS